jgi:hypothetical protein
VVDISERREIRVAGDDATFVFVAEPDDGRLTIREEREDAEPEELCSITLADRDELRGFLQGLRRALGVDAPSADEGVVDQRQGGQLGAAGEPARALSRGDTGGGAASVGRDDGDREAAIERARQRGHGNAFAAWTPDEEGRLLEAADAGRDLDDLAREHGRSRRAIEMRLEKLRR